MIKSRVSCKFVVNSGWWRNVTVKKGLPKMAGRYGKSQKPVGNAYQGQKCEWQFSAEKLTIPTCLLKTL